MPGPNARLIPDCRVFLSGQKLEGEKDAALVRVQVDLDIELFGQCYLLFSDPQMKLMESDDFSAGTPVKVSIGYGSKATDIFEGEVVALEPLFRRDVPPMLRVVCHEAMHRLALTTMTRALNEADDGDIVGQIAQEKGLSGEGPSGTKEYVLQSNVSDAVFLRRLAQKQGHRVRLEGTKLMVGPPESGDAIVIGPADGLRRMKVKIKAGAQVSQVEVYGYDPKSKEQFVGKAKGQGEMGEGSKEYGDGATLSLVGREYAPIDTATAERYAKGRMAKLSEGFVVAQMDMIGNPDVVPGADVKFDKFGPRVDGEYRVDQARHEFGKNGFFTQFKAVRKHKK